MTICSNQEMIIYFNISNRQKESKKNIVSTYQEAEGDAYEKSGDEGDCGEVAVTEVAGK